MKLYVLQDLNDPTKYKIEARSSSAGTICEAPNGAVCSDAPYISISDVLIDGIMKKVATVDVISRDADIQNEANVKALIQYKEDRRKAYPPIGDQLDALYKKLALDDSTDWDAIAAQIAQVKTTYPKPE